MTTGAASTTARSEDGRSPPRSRSPGLRIAAILALALALLAAGRLAGLDQRLDPARLRAALEASGPAGALLFVLAFVAGELVHVPGLIFVGVAVAGWGPVVGGALGFGAALLSVTTSFVLVRSVGGRALADIDRPLLKRLLAPLERRPVRTVILLRLVFVLSPPLNYALALSPVRLRDYVVGSAVGLGPPVLAAILLFDWIF